MTSRWTWTAALAAAVSLGGCEKRKAPAAAPPEPAPAETAAGTPDAPPTAAVDVQAGADAAAHDPAGTDEPKTARAGQRRADAGATARDDERPGKEGYCDAPADCEGLMHVTVVGKWTCVKHRCAWKSEGGSGPQ